jgi:hypothetical protein
VHLVGFGDRRKAQDLPRLLREHVADEVVFVQPLHDDDDGAVAFVVQSALPVELGVGVRILLEPTGDVGLEARLVALGIERRAPAFG